MDNYFDPYKLLQFSTRVQRAMFKADDYAPPIPVCVDMSISNKCNHRCWFCSAQSQLDKGGVMDIAHMRWMLKELAQTGVRAITFEGGGEPAYGPLEQALRACKELGLDAGLITNGSLSDGQIGAVLESCRWVRISLDSATPTIHSMMHGTPERKQEEFFDRILDNVRELVDCRLGDKPTIGLSFLLSTKNHGDLLKFIDLCNELQVDYGEVKRLHGSSYDERQMQSILQEKQRWMDYQKKNHPDGVPVYIRVNTEKDKLAPTCYASRIAGPAIEPDGTMYVCCNHKNERKGEYSYGVWEKDVSFIDFWTRPERIALANRVVSSGWDANEACYSCKLRTPNHMMHSIAHPTSHQNFI